MALADLAEIITIERETLTDDGDGHTHTSAIATLGTMYAAVKAVRASESERQGALREVHVYLFTVHAAEVRELDIRSRDRIVWSGKAMNIREVRLGPAREAFAELVAEWGVTL